VGGATHGGILKLRNSVKLFWNCRPTARTMHKWRLNAMVAEAEKAAAKMADSKKKDYSESRKESLIV